MASALCPQPDELRSFARGDLAAGDFERIASHVESCTECDATLEALGREPDELATQLKHLSEPVSASGNTQLLLSHVAAVDSVGLLIDPGRYIARHLDGRPFRIGRFEMLAELGMGSFGYVFRARDTAQLAGIYSELDRLEAVAVAAAPVRPRIERYPWPLAGALVLAVLAFAASRLTAGRQVA